MCVDVYQTGTILRPAIKEIEILVWDFTADHRGALIDFPVIP